MEKLSIGSKGPQVKQLQLTLNKWMLPPYNRLISPVLPRLQDDGLFGPKTEERLRGFQRFRLLPESGELNVPTLLSMYPKLTLDTTFLLKTPGMSATGNPLFAPIPPLRKSGDSDSGFEYEIELKDVSGRSLGGVNVDPDDLKWKTEKELEFSTEVASTRLKGLGIYVSGALTNGVSLEGALQAKLKLPELGPFELSPYLGVGLGTEAWKNFSVNAETGLDLSVRVFGKDGQPTGAFNLSGGLGASNTWKRDENGKPESSLGFPVSFSALFKVEY